MLKLAVSTKLTKSFDFSKIPCFYVRLLSISEILHEREKNGQFLGWFHLKPKLILTRRTKLVSTTASRRFPVEVHVLTRLICLSISVARITVTS